MTNSSIHVGGVGKRSSSATTGGIRIHEDVNGNIYTVNIFWEFENNVPTSEIIFGLWYSELYKFIIHSLFEAPLSELIWLIDLELEV